MRTDHYDRGGRGDSWFAIDLASTPVYDPSLEIQEGDIAIAVFDTPERVRLTFIDEREVNVTLIPPRDIGVRVATAREIEATDISVVRQYGVAIIEDTRELAITDESDGAIEVSVLNADHDIGIGIFTNKQLTVREL